MWNIAFNIYRLLEITQEDVRVFLVFFFFLWKYFVPIDHIFAVFFPHHVLRDSHIWL